MTPAWISLIIFVLSYTLFVLLPNRRPWIACIGGLMLMATGVLSWQDALWEKINWNVMGLFLGTLILAELFLLSRVPARLAEWLVDHSRSTRLAMFALCVLASGLSIFIENVAVVLLVAPVALSLADKLKINPVPLLIGIAVCSNLQGTATMIGDPPSMILAGYMRMGFMDFFIYHGRPSIFFAVQVGALTAIIVLAMAFRRHRGKVILIAQENVRSWFPTILLGLLIVGLSFATMIDPNFTWFAGVYTLLLGALALLWQQRRTGWRKTGRLLRMLDWDTTFFLIGVFVLVGGLSDSGWMNRLADVLVSSVGTSVPLAFATIVLFAVVASAFVDNVPFLLMMIPVTQQVADRIGAPGPLLMFGLLIGACLGGNLTPIGASANVVTLGILRKRGYTVSFREFMAIGVPFTVAAVAGACTFVWWIWRPVAN